MCVCIYTRKAFCILKLAKEERKEESYICVLEEKERKEGGRMNSKKHKWKRAIKKV